MARTSIIHGSNKSVTEKGSISVFVSERWYLRPVLGLTSTFAVQINGLISLQI